MEIPKNVREQLDKIYEAPDNMDYIIDYKGRYLPKKGNALRARHYHHIDIDRDNNELWNLVPISYQDHIVGIHSKNNPLIKQDIYNFMIERYPEHEEHYRYYLLEEHNKFYE